VQEQEILQKIRSGEVSAFREVFDTFHGMVFDICCRMIGNRHEAEDITQEIFINAYKSLNRFRGESKLSTWLYRIAINHCLNYQSRKKWQQWLSLDFISETEPEQNPASHNNRPDTLLEQKETESIIQKCILSLPKQQQTALILHRYEGLSYQEIAQIMNCSVSSVESRLFRAKQSLCAKLRPFLKEL